LSCHPDKEYRCFQLKILGVWHLRGVFSGLSLLQHGNEVELEKNNYSKTNTTKLMKITQMIAQKNFLLS